MKLTFFRGASLKDPKKLFNSSLEGNTRRAIDLREGEKINEAAFKQLIRAAVAANSAARRSNGQPRRSRHLTRWPALAPTASCPRAQFTRLLVSPRVRNEPIRRSVPEPLRQALQGAIGATLPRPTREPTLPGETGGARRPLGLHPDRGQHVRECPLARLPRPPRRFLQVQQLGSGVVQGVDLDVAAEPPPPLTWMTTSCASSSRDLSCAMDNPLTPHRARIPSDDKLWRWFW